MQGDWKYVSATAGLSGPGIDVSDDDDEDYGHNGTICAQAYVSDTGSSPVSPWEWTVSGDTNGSDTPS